MESVTWVRILDEAFCISFCANTLGNHKRREPIIQKAKKKKFEYEQRLKKSCIIVISSISGKGVAPSPTSQCNSYWKGSLLVALDYGRQLTGKGVAPSPTSQCNSYWKGSPLVALDNGRQLTSSILEVDKDIRFISTENSLYLVLQDRWHYGYWSLIKELLKEIIWRLQVQSWLQVKITRNINNS